MDNDRLLHGTIGSLIGLLIDFIHHIYVLEEPFTDGHDLIFTALEDFLYTMECCLHTNQDIPIIREIFVRKVVDGEYIQRISSSNHDVDKGYTIWSDGLRRALRDFGASSSVINLFEFYMEEVYDRLKE